MEEGRSLSKLSGGRALGRPMLRLEENVRMDVKGIGVNTRNWIDLVSNRECVVEPPYYIIL